MARGQVDANSIGLGLEQAWWARGQPKGVIQHSYHGSQYVSTHYSERLSEAGFNALLAVSVIHTTETINGLYKTEVIGPGKG